MSAAVPWYAEEDWQPPGVRQLGTDHALERDLREWTFGKPLTAGLPYAYAPPEERGGGYLNISYRDGREFDSGHGSWSISARQDVTGRELAVFGYASFCAAAEDCLGMARDYEREDLLDLAMPGLA